MCPQPPKSIYLSIAENEDAPEAIRAAAQEDIAQIPLQAALEGAMSGEFAMVDVPWPFSGATDFACSIHTIANQVFRPGVDAEGIEINPKNPDKVQLPGLLMKASWGYEPDPNDKRIALDEACHKTYDGFLATWTFYKDIFGRNSIDDNGLEIRATIHLNEKYNNAFRLRSARAMFFGDAGSNNHPANATYNMDIIGHELTHGVIEMTAALGAEQPLNSQAEVEAFTLNEHIADCFGIMIKQYHNKETSKDGCWDIGQGWWVPSCVQKMKWTGDYMRTFRKVDPYTQPDQNPKHMTRLKKWEYVSDPHENSGIPSRAFYEAAQLFGGHTWENVGRIWYSALTDEVFKDPKEQTFAGWSKLTTQHARKLFDKDGEDKMRTAWRTVGITV